MSNKINIRDMKGYFQSLVSFNVSEATLYWLPPEHSDVGYTSVNKEIYINPDHKLFNGLNDEKRVAAVLGIIAHEIMHLFVTPFKKVTEFCDQEIPELVVQKLFQEFLNVLEDPNIEYQASNFLSNKLLKALYFVIGFSYNNSKALNIDKDGNVIPPSSENDEGESYFELLRALVQFGDGGFIKGEFVSPVAKNYYNQILPKVDEYITSNNINRVSLGYEIFKEIEPLWRPIVNNYKAISQLSDLLRELGKDISSDGCSNGENGENTNDSSNNNGANSVSSLINTLEDRRRQAVDQAIKENKSENNNSSQNTKQNTENGSNAQQSNNGSNAQQSNNGSNAQQGNNGSNAQQGNNGSNAQQGNNGSNTQQGNNGSNAQQGNNGSNAQQGNNGSNTQQGNNGSNAQQGNSGSNAQQSNNGSNAQQGNNGSNTQQSNNGSNSQQGNNGSNAQGENGSNANNNGGEVHCNTQHKSEQGYNSFEKRNIDLSSILSDDDINSLIRQAQESVSVKKLNPNSLLYEKVEKCVKDGRFSQRKLKVRNNIIQSSSSLKYCYENVCSLYASLINSLYHDFKKIIKDDIKKRSYGQDGRLEVGRVIRPIKTANVFSRTPTNKGKDDVCISVLIDQSGSMHGPKLELAKHTAVILSEVCAKIKYPLAVMGYAETSGYDSEHYHYLRFEKKPTALQRYALMNIGAGGCNFDGYAIYFMTEIMAKRKEQHKIMFVLTDGRPNARNGTVNDAIQAVRNAGKKGIQVVGLGIQTSEAVLKDIYGKYYISVTDAKTLPTLLPQQLRKIVKSW